MSELLDGLSREVQARFAAERRVMGFSDFVDAFAANPGRLGRSAAVYLRDCMDHFGVETLHRPGGDVQRWKLFDAPFDGDIPRKRRDYLAGQEAVQAQFYQVLNNFVREGRVNRLVLLHGPNGSAKSTFCACLMRGLEHYSQLDEGALYRIAWVFQRGADGKRIGFSGLEDPRSKSGDGDARLPDELREHPLLLLPLAERRAMLTRAYSGRGEPPDWLWNGLPSQKNRQILEALLVAYKGDLGRVLGHVQVERFYVSRRYRVGAVTLGPQMAVDAHERQLSADHSVLALPASLSAVTLYEPFGELVNAAGGVLEFSDLLKRPLEAWKYLLLAIESGEVSLAFSTLTLNMVLVGSSNEVLLHAFREHPEYNSFRGRLQLIRMPLLLDYVREQEIYDAQLVPQLSTHVAPHVIRLAALWAVLTRLKRPRAERFESRVLGRVSADLTPIEKADLYARGQVPQRLSSDHAQDLARSVHLVLEEGAAGEDYEGLLGVSPREVRGLILAAAQRSEYAYLSPLAVLDAIREFCRHGDHDSLKVKPDGLYHDAGRLLEMVEQRWLDLVDEELRHSTGLVDEHKYVELFDKYILHVSFWSKNERLYNRMTGSYDEPDVDFMRRTEAMFDAGEPDAEFRKALISKVAAWAIDHPGEPIDYARLFPPLFEKMRASFFEEHRQRLGEAVRDILAVVSNKVEALEGERRERADRALHTLESQHGYNRDSARDALAELLKQRYQTA